MRLKSQVSDNQIFSNLCVLNGVEFFTSQGAQSLLNFATISFILQSPPVNPTLLVELCVISCLS